MVTICWMSSIPSPDASSMRPTKGEMYVAPALAASSACDAEKHSVTLVRIPSCAKTRTAFRPSSMSGTLTTTFLWIFASSRPSRRISSRVVASTSAEMGPSTISQISAITWRVGLPALARSDGLVVTPSMAPIAWASLISAMSPVSMKIFIASLPAPLRRKAAEA